jgi:hypothetical protein
MPTYVHSLHVDDDDDDWNPHLTTKCKNFDIWCKTKIDDLGGLTRAAAKGLCINCDMKFGEALELVEDVECPVCLEVRTGIRQLNCIHSSCKTCFLKMNIGMWDLDTRPVEPPHETEIDEDGEEIVKLPNPEYEQWCEDDYQWEQNGYAKDNTRKCPLCRQ